VSTAQDIAAMRKLVQEKKHFVSGVWLWGDMAHKACGGDFERARDLLAALDVAVPRMDPPASFSMWADGGEWCMGRWDYSNPRPVQEISALMAKAMHIATRGGGVRQSEFA
jgi:hypothetical protein